MIDEAAKKNNLTASSLATIVHESSEEIHHPNILINEHYFNIE
jgi:hypothetical protein